MASILQFLWFGIVTGSIIALGALGLTMLFGIMNFINLAYGEYMAIGAYLTLVAYNADLPIWGAAIVGIVAGALLAIVTSLVFFRHFRDRSPIILLVVSIGVGFVLRNTIRAIWTPSARYITTQSSEAIRIGGLRILQYQLLIIGTALVLVTAVYFLLQRTKLGIGLRALSDNMTLAQVRGVETERLITVIWLLAGGIAGIAGIMLAIDSQIKPNMGFTFLIPLFAAVFIGGIGDPVGAVIGGFTLGIAMKLSLFVIPSSYQHAVALAILVGGLLWRPEGVFRESKR